MNSYLIPVRCGPRCRWLLMLLIGFLLLHRPAGHAGAEAVEATVGRAEAHQFMVRGDQARDRRLWAEAIRSYQAAHEMFRVLGTTAPAVDRDYYTFREEYNRREIRLIEQQTGRTAEAWLETESSLTAADAERYRLLYYTMRRENQQLRDRVEELEDDLELMLEMEELDRQREQARRQQPASPPSESIPEFDELEIEPVPTRLSPPSPELERGPFRRRQPTDPVRRR